MDEVDAMDFVDKNKKKSPAPSIQSTTSTKHQAYRRFLATATSASRPEIPRHTCGTRSAWAV